MLILKRVIFSYILMISVSFAQTSDFVSTVEQLIQTEVATRLDISTDDIDIQYLGLKNTTPCEGAQDILIDIPAREDFRMRSTIMIEAYKDNTLCGKWTTQAKMVIWKLLPVAEQNFQSGEIVTVQWEKRRWDTLTFAPLSISEQEFQAIVPIQKGAVVLSNQIRVQPDQFRGDSVILVYEHGSLRIQVDAHMMMDAVIGDEVKVVAEHNNSIVVGILVDKGLVKIRGN